VVRILQIGWLGRPVLGRALFFLEGDDVFFPKFTRQFLRLGDLGGGHEFGGNFFAFFATIYPLRGRNAKSRIRAHIVLGDALAFGVTPTNQELRLRIPLFRSLGPPVNRLGIVLGDADG